MRFAGQVVATPSLPYNGPVDKVVTNMNWISSIVETEREKDSLKQEIKPPKPIIAKPLEKTVLKSKKEIAKKNDKKKTAKDLKKDKKGKNDKKNTKTNSKQKSPKYVYPKKDH